ncbi:MAG TPA: 16S rRNA (cytosine(1402)-N(4))-methyltransferase RsmH [Tepidisphaeraceae bacterium]|nr:16S rRNA (cytosine(1402)-N(4))-methyltransferase RsmH [Tepidisphaeraceae bacterium]
MSTESEFDRERMTRHEPVMLREVLAFLQCRPGGSYVDGTCGLGGHAQAILEASAPDGQLLAIDRDAAALDLCRERLASFGERVRFAHDNFRNIPLILNNLALSDLDGILLDLGVSSMQLEDEARGFSFQRAGLLDMRMDRRQRLTAADLINDLEEEGLADLIYKYGEEPASRRIARRIVESRRHSPIRTTTDLAAIVEKAAGRPAFGRSRRHLATRTFQALRIAVNDELRDLDLFIEELCAYVGPGGRMVVISFHSLEDRMIKTAFRRLAGQCVCGLPVAQCRCPRQPRVTILTPRPEIPQDDEIDGNPRARSAKLRAAMKL